jgi:hypothetical protein
LNRFSSNAATDPPTTGKNARSAKATTGAGRLPDHQIATRPDSHRADAIAKNGTGAVRVFVQLGAAVSKKPAIAADP